MKRLVAYTCTLAVIALLATSEVCHAEELVHINFGLIPLGLGIAPDQEEYEAVSPTGSDRIAGEFHWAPELFAGVDIRTPASGGSAGIFVTEIMRTGLSGSLYGAELAYILPHADNTEFLQRLKVGAFYADLDWEGDHTNVDFEETIGYQAGYAFDADLGQGAVAIHCEVLYRQMEFDARTGLCTQATSDTLDLSGVVLNLGVRFDFPVGGGE